LRLCSWKWAGGGSSLLDEKMVDYPFRKGIIKSCTAFFLSPPFRVIYKHSGIEGQNTEEKGGKILQKVGNKISETLCDRVLG
jgi:hypothetical protein